MGGEKVLDFAGHLNASVGDEYEVVGHPLELHKHVGGEQDRHAILGSRGHHRGHEVVAGDRVQRGHRLIEEQEPRPAGQRQRQRQLGLLAARHLPRLAVQRDAELAQAMLGVVLVEAAIQVPRLMQQVGGREVLVERRVLCHEGDLVDRGERTSTIPAEHRHLAATRVHQPDREVQQGRLAGTVWSYQGDYVLFGDRQRAVMQRAGRAVGLAESVGFDDVHATPSAS